MTQFKKRGGLFLGLGVLFPRLLKRTVFDQPTVDNGGVSRGRSAAVAIGTSMALQWQFNSTSTAIQWHINGNSTAIQRQKIKNKIGASISIGQESQCLPNSGLFQQIVTERGQTKHFIIEYHRLDQMYEKALVMCFIPKLVS